MKYEVKFDFTGNKQDELREKVWPVDIGKRIIKSELGLSPIVENPDGDVRYETDDPEIFIELMKICVQHAAGGWWTAAPMPPGAPTVFHLPNRGGKYAND